MHGRIKTISSAEQKLKQEKLRKAKVEAYTTTLNAIQKKRLSQEYDDEALQLTRDVLLANPDIITLWNFRREIFLYLQGDDNVFKKLMEGELNLTEQCLRVNPKSYGSWHHREWVLKNMPNCDWAKEVLLCNKYLSYDERNFHCWDYRRTVTKLADVSNQLEYEFTTLKIESNFSNYSAWHLRSKLLPKLFPDQVGQFPLAEEKHKEELEMVQNAAFTDPDDQSAWFYQRWLLGLHQQESSVVFAYVESQSLIVALSNSLYLGYNYDMHVAVNESKCSGSWYGTAGHFSSIWIFNFSHEVPVCANLTLQLEKNGISLEILQVSPTVPLKREPTLFISYSAALISTFKEQLECCRQLLELEPDSKWTLLTQQLLMQNIDAILFQEQIFSSLNKLVNVDPLRSGYYHDMISKFKIELLLSTCYKASSISLASEGLTCLYHTQFLLFVKKVDLSNNKLNNFDLKNLHSLINCNILILNGNNIKSLKKLPNLRKLTDLSALNNPLEDVGEDTIYINSFPCMKNFIV